jgi:dephospho-CoA kinase
MAPAAAMLPSPVVLLIGLTGSIGSGKSTVSADLARRGADVVDADAIVREVQRPGSEVFDGIVARFGPEILQADGQLDRQAIADVVFADPKALRDLNGLVHPAVGAEIARRLDPAARSAEPDRVVILDVPLLVESGRDDMAGLIVVDTDPDVAVRRLVDQRGFREADARARMARQASRADRLARADFVIENDGGRDALQPQIDACWTWIESLSSGGGGG